MRPFSLPEDLTKEQQKRIKILEKEIQEGDSLWKKLKKIPSEDKSILKQLKGFINKHKVTKKPKTPKAIKEKANKLFWGIEPPEKPKKPKR